jgi:thiol-disulfide isomerase/thioredoxin
MQKSSKIYLIVGLILALVIIGVVVVVGKGSTGPGQLDEFATCLKDQGAVFYGAFWCSHCQATKALFGKSAKFLPYVECSTPDGSAQTQVCKDKKIESYPTWVFKDSSQLNGEVTLEALSGKTGCPISPTVATSTATTTVVGTITASPATTTFKIQ